MAKRKRAGTVYINVVEDPIRGTHASFHIFLNQKSQGKQIGRRAYELGCAGSQHEVIYAHMRKSNIASRKAAYYAGFNNASTPQDSQLVLVWRRKHQNSSNETTDQTDQTDETDETDES